MKENPGKSRILVVDDNQVNLRFLEQVLDKEGFEVFSTQDSFETLSLAIQYSPHLILLDLMMPGISGLETLNQLHQNRQTQGVPVLMVTARTSGEDVRAALEAGAFDYVKKPLDEVEVVARVRSALRYKAHQDKLVEMAMHDSLTGLYNHRLLLDLLDKELAAGQRKGQSVCFCMVDIDHFKAFNDRYGHQVGDRLLVEISQLLSQGLRKTDPIGRYGGEEFGIVLGGCEPDKARILCERLRKAVEEHLFDVGQPVRLTISLGLAAAPPGEGVDGTALVHRADQALYQAKAQGRNRLVG